MAETTKWRDGVRVVRADSLNAVMHGATGTGRATAFDFSGAGGRHTWIGAVTLQPKAKTGAHHHVRHEVAAYVVTARSELRCGGRLALSPRMGPGGFHPLP